MKHIIFAAVVIMYVVTIGQNWAFFAAALLVYLWVRNRGRLDAVPDSVGLEP